MMRRRFVAWVIIRDGMFYDFVAQRFCSQFGNNCFSEFKNHRECKMIASNLKAESLALWVGADLGEANATDTFHVS